MQKFRRDLLADKTMLPGLWQTRLYFMVNALKKTTTTKGSWIDRELNLKSFSVDVNTRLRNAANA